MIGGLLIGKNYYLVIAKNNPAHWHRDNSMCGGCRNKQLGKSQVFSAFDGNRVFHIENLWPVFILLDQ